MCLSCSMRRWSTSLALLWCTVGWIHGFPITVGWIHGFPIPSHSVSSSLNSARRPPCGFLPSICTLSDHRAAMGLTTMLAGEGTSKARSSGSAKQTSTETKARKSNTSKKDTSEAPAQRKGGAAGGEKVPGAKKSENSRPKRPRVELKDDYAWPRSSSTEFPDLNVLNKPLGAKQLLQFNVDGHTITRDLCSAKEIAPYIPVVRSAFVREELEAKRQKVRVLFGKADYMAAKTVELCDELLDEVDPEYIPFLQTFNSWRRYQDVRRFALAKRFGHVAAQLLGVPRVRLYQDSTFTKRSGDGPTLWHSDLNMAPFDTNDFVTMWMPVTEVPDEEEGGTGLTFASRSHRDFALSFWKDPHAAEDLGERYDVAGYGGMRPGDATWHHGWTLHSSPGNDLGEDRVAISLAFVADNARLLGAKAEHRPDDEDDLSYADWLADFKPGGKITDHRLLPLVYDEAVDGPK